MCTHVRTHAHMHALQHARAHACTHAHRFGEVLFSTVIWPNWSCADAVIKPDMCIHPNGLRIMEGFSPSETKGQALYLLHQMRRTVDRYSECLMPTKLPISAIENLTAYRLPSDDPSTFANLVGAWYFQLQLRLHSRQKHGMPSSVVFGVKTEHKDAASHRQLVFQRLTEYRHESCHSRLPKPIWPTCMCKADYIEGDLQA